MSGTLYVVATPIGNLEDVTMRALRVLREVALIAAEDTRRTARLLQHYSISTPTTSLHEHNEYARTPVLIQRLLDGDSIAVVSDAGTPVISDPGNRLVAAAHEASIRVEAIPGPSAVVAVLSASGLGGQGFLFAGFVPSRAKDRKRWLEQFRELEYPVVLFEAPHRIRQTLSAIHESLGEVTVAIGRELTKQHELLAVRPIWEWLADPPPERGEFSLVISVAASVPVKSPVPEDAQLAHEFGQLTNKVLLGRREAIRELSVRHGLPNREVFAALERAKNLVD